MKNFATVALVVLMFTLSFASMACATDTKAEGEEVILKGMVDADNRFIDESGQAYQMAVNEKATEIMANPGQKIEIKGTVMEKEGVKTVVVNEFMALP